MPAARRPSTVAALAVSDWSPMTVTATPRSCAWTRAAARSALDWVVGNVDAGGAQAQHGRSARSLGLVADDGDGDTAIVRVDQGGGEIRSAELVHLDLDAPRGAVDKPEKLGEGRLAGSQHGDGVGTVRCGCRGSEQHRLGGDRAAAGWRRCPAPRCFP